VPVADATTVGPEVFDASQLAEVRSVDLSAAGQRHVLERAEPTGCGLGHGDRFVDIFGCLSALMGMDAAVRPADTPRRGSGFPPPCLTAVPLPQQPLTRPSSELLTRSLRPSSRRSPGSTCPSPRWWAVPSPR
jgi:hypothetical protein